MKRQSLRLREREAVQAMLEKKSGSERMALELFSSAIASKLNVSPAFQELVNLIVVRALLAGKLPPRLRGRTPDSRVDPVRVADRYWELCDEGSRSDDAAEQIARDWHIEPRYVYEQVSRVPELSGMTRADRDEMRRICDLTRGREVDNADAPVDPRTPFLLEPRSEEIDEMFEHALRAALLAVNASNSVQ